MIQHYTGEDLSKSIKRKTDTGTYYDLEITFSEIIVYFVNGTKTVKFSKTAKSGYTQMIKISSTEYSCELSSDDTYYLGAGSILCSMNFIANASIEDARLNKIIECIPFQLIKSKTETER
jgi:hypothetical protein